MEKTLERILLSVQNPARYIGGETNTPTIDPNARVKFCVLSPELYEVGMSDIKFKTIYHKVNDRKGNACERCFAPWLDMASAIKKNGIKLFSLESKRPLDAFDVIGVKLSVPADYTTALYCLDLGGVPVEQSKRTSSHPLVFGWGDACVNAEVVSAFLDFVILGDAEEVVLPVIDCIKSAQTNKFSREQTLAELSKLQSVYVPTITMPKYDKHGKIDGFTTPKIKKAVAVDLDRCYYPSMLQVPNIKCIQECAGLEPIRGCTRGCRFCMHGFISRPIRERRVSVLSSAIMTQVTTMGVKDIYLGSRCFGDYTRLSALMKEVKDVADEKDARILIPSFEGAEEYSDFVRLESKDTIALTIEAGTETLRNKINKVLSNARIDEALVKIFGAGYHNIKINFMIGLPFETGADLMGIVETVKSIKSLYRKHKKSSKAVYITCTIANFVPKPFTPFAWCESITPIEAEKRFKFVKKSLKGLGVRVKLYSPEYSAVESILSRGDRKVSQAIVLAYKCGAVFDKNPKLFNFEAYEKAFKIAKVEINTELSRRDTNVIQPWENADMMVSRDYLLAEYEKAKKGIITPDCRMGCKACGLSDKGVCKHGNL